MKIKYRTWIKGEAPRPIKLDVPGWAGEKHWNTGQPWHCKPFVDAATYGLEITYPFDTEVTVIAKNGVSEFVYESDAEWRELQIKSPFANFAPNHFGFTSALDIQTEPGFGTMILPHPRYFTDMTGTVPLPVHGLIESDWWPKIFFMAFRAPLEGQEYKFRKGDGIAQVIFVPKQVEYEISPMSEKEAKKRAKMEETISAKGAKIMNRSWQDKEGQIFDNKYKVLSMLDKKSGPGAVQKLLESLEEMDYEQKGKDEAARRSKMQRRLITR